MESEMHDAEILAVKVDSERRTFSVDLRRQTGESVSLEYGGVIEIRVADFAIQNVVSRVITIDQTTIGRFERSNELLGWVCFRQNSGEIEELAEMVREGVAQLVYYEPSVGAEIGVIFRHQDHKDGQAP